MTIWRGSNSLVLASQSRTRQMLLANAGLGCEAMAADIDERAIQHDLQQSSELAAPSEIASLLSREKALWVSSRKGGHHVIGADQTLALGDRLFNKPRDRGQAGDQLRALAGRRHELHSAVAVARDGKIVFADVAVAHMTMRPLNETEIAAYLDAAGEAVLSSVGAYQLEGLGVHLFARIEGDHFTILGLPLLPLLAFLRGQRLLAI
jgi:septum formation protein